MNKQTKVKDKSHVTIYIIHYKIQTIVYIFKYLFIMNFNFNSIYILKIFIYYNLNLYKINIYYIP